MLQFMIFGGIDNPPRFGVIFPLKGSNDTVRSC